ncbi:hypothetical protein C2845_PM09G16120 [Panicum miliaceum]|uniref:Uncharacterized protein n=1 Tax=Panicum miliaceum TaxID=4540 RepID=A0A3L6S0L4_PANMI|nr:hypothetical protein C2845_PM09G16120 [Panicum miliaceum]
MGRGGELRDGARRAGGEQHDEAAMQDHLPQAKEVMLESDLVKTYGTKNDYCLFSAWPKASRFF